ncbi:hypothetical protein ACFT8W_38545 [Streptomyces hygroscopicus]|uniref:hypothetical protein n=1 Tax=Streptomyces hygroscopicus TaxID=1912 RepID=UPI00362B4EC7
MRSDTPEQRSHILLIAGGRAIRRRPVRIRVTLAPSDNLAALLAVPATVLIGSTLPCDTVHLDGIHDPAAVLLRLHSAAATSGPLLLYVSGRLTADRRTHHLRLALDGTTPFNASRHGVPWAWLRAALQHRPAASVTVLTDLAADRHAWPLLRADPGLLTAELPVYGTVTPPGCPATYTRTFVQQLRAAGPDRPGIARLHALAVAAAELPPGTLVLPAASGLVPAPGLPLTVQRLSTQLDEQPRPIGPPDRLSLSPAQQQPEESAQAIRAEYPQPFALVPVQGPQPPPAGVPAPPVPEQPRQQDPRPYIWQTAQAGRHSEAAAMATAWEQQALRTHGVSSAEATQWTEIRADLARMAGNYLLATQLWASAARTRLAHQAPDAPEVHTAAQGAAFCWQHIKAPSEARDSGPELIALLRQVPGLDPRYLPWAERRLQYLQRSAPL